MEKISPIKEKILYFIEKQGITKTDFCKNTGISYANLKGKGLFSEIGGTQIGKILSYYNELSPEWLITDKGQMLRKTKSSNYISDSSNSESQTIDLEYKDKDNSEITKENQKKILISENLRSDNPEGISLYNVMASAGFGSFDELLTNENLIGKYNIPDLKADFMIYVKGNSMYPKYSNKDIIGCKRIYERHFILWNKPHVIATREHGLLVKRVQECNQPDCIIAVSDNKDYPPVTIPVDEILGFAIVTGVIRLE